MQDTLTRLRKIRETKGLSQEYVGESIGLDRVRYNLIETGKRAIKLDEVFKIAQVLECDINEIITSAYEKKNYPGLSLELPYKNIVQEANAPYYRESAINDMLRKENIMLQKENEMLKQLLADKEKIIKLLESK